jgi:hypothetical protein
MARSALIGTCSPQRVSLSRRQSPSRPHEESCADSPEETRTSISPGCAGARWVEQFSRTNSYPRKRTTGLAIGTGKLLHPARVVITIASKKRLRRTRPNPHWKSLAIELLQQGLQLALTRQFLLPLAGHPPEEQQVEEPENQDDRKGRRPNNFAPGHGDVPDPAFKN